MTPKDWIDVLSGLASIATAVVAVLAYGGYKYGQWDRHRRLLALVKEHAARHPNPQYLGLQEVTIIRAVTDLRISEAQAMEAAFGDKTIVVAGLGPHMTFRYAPPTSN